jgi:hypothetical protein
MGRSFIQPKQLKAGQAEGKKTMKTWLFLFDGYLTGGR